MKKYLYILFAVLSVSIFGCSSPTTTEGSFPPPNDTPALSVISDISLMSTNSRNSDIVFAINNISENSGHTVDITVSDPTNQNLYEIQKGYGNYFGLLSGKNGNGYIVSIKNTYLEPLILKINVSVKNNAGEEIINTEVSGFVSTVLTPYYKDAVVTTPIDIQFNTDSLSYEYVIIKPAKYTIFADFDNNRWTATELSVTTRIASFGIDQLDNTSISLDKGFEVDEDPVTFTVGNQQYPNCLKQRIQILKNDCVVAISFDFPDNDSEAKLMFSDNRHSDTIINVVGHRKQIAP